MAWTIITSASLLSRLATAEQSALATVLTDSQDVLAEIASGICAEWRGGLARHVTLDVRPTALPAEVMVHVLADFRYRAYTRLPNMGSLLDELRVKEWERANQVRDNLGKISIEPPSPEYTPAETPSGSPAPSISSTEWET